jgi:HSP20 family protein
MPITPKRAIGRPGRAEIQHDRDRDPLRELLGDFPDRLRGDAWQPAVDIFETETTVVVRVEMAGVRAQDLKLNVDGELLRIRGVRPTRMAEGIRRLHQMEITFGPFESAIRVGIAFDSQAVSAHLEDGLLEVRLPKRLPVTVEVETE